MNARIIRPNSLPFNLRNVTAVLRGRLQQDEAKRRARMLLEDVPRLGGPLRLRWIGATTHEVWPYYTFDNYEFSESVRSVPTATCGAIGYGLNWGDLVTFSKVVKIARCLWGADWVRWFRERMTHFGNHLSTIEELWWLGLWDSPSHVERECAPTANCRTVDWQFQTHGIVINLEVKYRSFDWLRFLDARLYSMFLDTCFDGLAEKFPRKLAGQLNLVAVTLLGSLGPELRGRANAFLQAHPPIDGFLFWSIAARDSLECECVFRSESEFARTLLRAADEEDRWRNPFIIPAGLGFARPTIEPIEGFSPSHGLFNTALSKLTIHPRFGEPVFGLRAAGGRSGAQAE